MLNFAAASVVLLVLLSQHRSTHARAQSRGLERAIPGRRLELCVTSLSRPAGVFEGRDKGRTPSRQSNQEPRLAQRMASLFRETRCDCVDVSPHPLSPQSESGPDAGSLANPMLAP